MPVINVPQGAGLQIPAGTIQGSMYVFCVDPPDAWVGIALGNPPPPYAWSQIFHGNTDRVMVNGAPVWLWNAGPARVQVLYAMELEGLSVEEVEGVSAWTDDEELAKLQSRTAGK